MRYRIKAFYPMYVPIEVFGKIVWCIIKIPLSEIIEVPKPETFQIITNSPASNFTIDDISLKRFEDGKWVEEEL